MASTALVVSPPGPVRDGLAKCIRRLDARYRVFFASAADARAACPANARPRLIALDLEAPQARGSDTVRAFTEHFPGATLIVLSESVDPRTIDSVLRSGALAYIPKAYTEKQVGLLFQLALDGLGHRPYFPEVSAGEPAPTAPAHPDSAEALRDRGAALTKKEVEVLSYLAEGLPNKQIAAQLGIAVGTVKVHVTSILRKLDAGGRAHAIVLARRMKEIEEQQLEQGQRGDLVLDCLLPHVSHRHLRRGEVLFRKGDKGGELFYVQRGTVTLEEIGEDMGPGQIFGEIGVFAPQRARTATARCKTDVDLFCLDSEQVKSIYYRNPQFGLHLVTLLAQRLVSERMHA